MIRIELGEEVSPGVFAYSVPSHRLCGRSRQPMLDACRQIKSMGGPTAERAGLFREGRLDPDLTCRVDVGAELTVSEPNKGTVRFDKFRAFELAKLVA